VTKIATYEYHLCGCHHRTRHPFLLSLRRV